jgi:hypothetical protein
MYVYSIQTLADVSLFSQLLAATRQNEPSTLVYSS